MRNLSSLPIAAALIAVALAGACSRSPEKGVLTITGAGATFPYPLYSKWFYEYSNAHPEVNFNYQSIGSGGGIRQITEGTVDFGATDAPMTGEEMARLPGPVLHIPTAIGAVAVVYHLKGVEGGLRLSPDVLAEIFLGKIRKWSDPKISSLNPGVALPPADIVVVNRSDGSGTTDADGDELTLQWQQVHILCTLEFLCRPHLWREDSFPHTHSPSQRVAQRWRLAASYAWLWKASFSRAA